MTFYLPMQNPYTKPILIIILNTSEKKNHWKKKGIITNTPIMKLYRLMIIFRHYHMLKLIHLLNVLEDWDIMKKNHKGTELISFYK